MFNVPPSEIVNYIDSRLPDVKMQQDNPQRSILIQKDRYPTVITVLSMVDAIPEHLITLRDSAYFQYLEAVAAIRHAVTLWDTGLKQSIIDDARNGDLNPFTILKKHLETFNDEGAEPTTSELLFITDARFRELLRFDLSNVNQSLDNHEWKAATVLGGSVVEAFLLYKLQELKESDSSHMDRIADSLISSHRLRERVSDNLEKWYLSELTEAAKEASIINDDTAAQCNVARNFRNLIHPGRTVRLDQECNRGTAFAVVAAIELVIHDLT